MLHKNILPADNHGLYTWAVANAAARTALTVAPADVGKVCWQQDTGGFYVLTDDSPMTWVLLNLTGAIAAADVEIEDAGGDFTATTVEAALVELVEKKHTFGIACSDESTEIIEATGVAKFHWPVNATITKIFAGLNVAQASGDIITIDVNVAGSTVLSTKITIDNTETTSLTAVIAPVLSDADWDEGQLVTVDIDQCDAATAAAGLKLYMQYVLR